MKRRIRRGIATLLTLCMTLSLLPSTVFAADTVDISMKVKGTGATEISATSGDEIELEITAHKVSGTDASVAIDLPLGVDLVDGPGIDAIASNGALTTSPVLDGSIYVGVLANYFENNPVFSKTATPSHSAYNSITCLSGRLVYDMKDSTNAAIFTVTVKVNSAFVPVSTTQALETTLGNITATLTQSGTDYDASVSVKATAEQAVLGMTSFSAMEYAGDSININGGSLRNESVMVGNSNQLVLSAQFSLNTPFASTSLKRVFHNLAFEITVPHGSTLTSMGNGYIPTLSTSDVSGDKYRVQGTSYAAFVAGSVDNNMSSFALVTLPESKDTIGRIISTCMTLSSERDIPSMVGRKPVATQRR